jgi:hypothetical protein
MGQGTRAVAPVAFNLAMRRAGARARLIVAGCLAPLVVSDELIRKAAPVLVGPGR